MAEKGVEGALERGLFASRWLMAPMYIGLAVALAMLTIVFLRELAYYAPQALTMSADKAILAILTLIDLTLAANLLVIVLFSGYENFVSKIDIGNHPDRPDWMGRVDFGGLKMKLIASIVAISGIHLLKRFLCAIRRAKGVFIRRQLDRILHARHMRLAALIKSDVKDTGLRSDCVSHVS